MSAISVPRKIADMVRSYNFHNDSRGAYIDVD